MSSVGFSLSSKLAGKSQLGYGCMSLSSSIYKTPEGYSDEYGLKVLERAYELGVRHFDTAMIYGMGHNEALLGKFLSQLTTQQRTEIVIATKTGYERQGDFARPNGKPEFIRTTCTQSLQKLGLDRIDLLYLHRIDTSIPIEDTMLELKKLAEEGKIRGVGLSEASARTIRRAHAVFPITAVQLEWSLWSRDCEPEIIPTCRELGIDIVVYSPLGRGALTGSIQKPTDLQEGDSRLKIPRFSQEAIDKNRVFLEKMENISREKDGGRWSIAQLSLAWVLAQGKDVFPIPGTANISHLEENTATLDLNLSPEELVELSATVPPEGVFGQRFQSGMPSYLDNL